MPRPKRQLLLSAIVLALTAVPVAGLLQLEKLAVAQQVKLPPELRSITVGDVTVHFGGVRSSDDAKFPLEYAVTNLWFTFKGDRHRYPFKPSGELFFRDWNFKILSPDGRFVTLLDDRFGPFHVVSVARLKRYLQGKAKPDVVIYGWGTGASRFARGL